MLLNCGVGKDSSESLGLQGDQTHQSQRKSVLNIHWWDWCWNWNSNTLATWWKSWLIWENPDARKDWGQEQEGKTEDEMVGWHHRLNGHGFGWTPGVGDGEGGLACCGLGIAKSWTQLGTEPNCGLESLRRNGVAIIVNKRVWNAVLGFNLKNDRMVSVSKANHSISW